MTILLNAINIVSQFIPIVGLFWMIGLFNIDSLHKISFFPGSLNFSRILESKLFDHDKESPSASNAFKLQQWAVYHAQKNGMSTHWWKSELPHLLKEAFNHCTSNYKIVEMFHTIFDPQYFDIVHIPGMDELYFAGTKRDQDSKNSDQVFYTTHIDGPFGFVPYVSVYRCLIALNENSNIITHFPMNLKEVELNSGDIVAFDYNREIHYIESRHNGPNRSRVVAKCHFCIYPKGCQRLGKYMMFLNEEYNKLFRTLFLHTINPTTMIEKINSWVVLSATNIFVLLDMYVGHKNVLFISTVLLVYPKQNIRVMIFSTTHIFKSFSILLDNVNLYPGSNGTSVEPITFMRDIILFFLLILVCKQ